MSLGDKSTERTITGMKAKHFGITKAVVPKWPITCLDMNLYITEVTRVFFFHKSETQKSILNWTHSHSNSSYKIWNTGCIIPRNKP